MSVTLLSSNISKQHPVEPDYVKEAIEEEAASLDEKNDFVEKISSKLSKKSSTYKFIVLLTVVDSHKNIGEGVNIELSIGAVWESEKDGHVSFQVKKEDSLRTWIVTVFWVSVD